MVCVRRAHTSMCYRVNFAYWFSSAQNEHLILVVVAATTTTLRHVSIMLLKIKGSKWTFDSGAGHRDPHHKWKGGMDENHPYLTSTDQRVKMTHWFCIYRFKDQWSTLDRWFSSYHFDNLISLGCYVGWYQVVKTTTWSIQLVLCNSYSNNKRQ